jgi:hypothetical protein
VRRGLRALAVLTALTFGCATVRVPASGIADRIPVRDGVAEPQLALYVEGSKTVDPAEARRASEAARTALEAAVKEHAQVDGDTLLVVRAQGVTRTPGRRTDQKLAMAGMVVGAVVVVVAAVVAVVASRGKGGGAKTAAKPATARAGAAPPAAAPRPAAVRPAAAPRPAAVRPAAAPAPAVVRPSPAPRPLPAPAPLRPPIARDGGPAYVGPNVSIGIGFWIDAYGGPAPAPYAADWSPAPEPLPEEPPPSGWDVAPAPPAPAAPLEAVWLAAPKPLVPEARGFFAGDELVLELVLVDRRDGTPLWSKVVQTDVDPTDAAAVRRVVSAALGSGDWMPATDLIPAAR